MALNSVLGKNRARDQPCYLGSIKSNIGHTESAAGVAGLIKTCLAIYNAQIPPNIHFDTPNPAIDWENISFRVPTGGPQEWPAWATSLALPRIASVNSFGFGGTNAHVILSSFSDFATEGERNETDTEKQKKWLPFPITANNVVSLKLLVEKILRYSESKGDNTISFLEDLLHSLANHRTHLRVRAVFITDSYNDFVHQLAKYGPEIDTKPHERVCVGKSKVSTNRKVLFLFSGQGSQWQGMAVDLLSKLPPDSVFRKTLDLVQLLLEENRQQTRETFVYAKEYPSSITHLLQSAQINETMFAQTAIFAVQVALAEQLKAWGK